MTATKEDEGQVLHDLLLSMKPEDAIHDADACAYCTPDNQENTVPDTLTDAEVEAKVEAAVAEATKANLARIAELESAQEVSTHGAEIAALQVQVDQALAAAKAAEDTLTATVKYLEDAEAEAKSASEREDLKVKRTAELAGLISDERIAERADAYTDMPEEAFTAILDDMRGRVAPSKDAEVTIPKATAMTASEGEAPGSNARSVIVDFYKAGVDTRSLV